MFIWHTLSCLFFFSTTSLYLMRPNVTMEYKGIQDFGNIILRILSSCFLILYFRVVTKYRISLKLSNARSQMANASGTRSSEYFSNTVLKLLKPYLSSSSKNTIQSSKPFLFKKKSQLQYLTNSS